MFSLRIGSWSNLRTKKTPHNPGTMWRYYYKVELLFFKDRLNFNISVRYFTMIALEV